MFLQKLSRFKPEIERALCIQVHLVRTCSHYGCAQKAGLKPFEGVDPEGLAVPTLSRRTHCVCKPPTRLRSKTPRKCTGSCRECSVRFGALEDELISLCRASLPIPLQLSRALAKTYPVFSDLFRPLATFIFNPSMDATRSVLRKPDVPFRPLLQKVFKGFCSYLFGPSTQVTKAAG